MSVGNLQQSVGQKLCKMHGTHLKPSAKSAFTAPHVSCKENMAERLTSPPFRSYLALGLQHDLNPISSGGSELNSSRTIDPINTRHPHSTASTDNAQSSVSEGPTVAPALPQGFGRIIRDSSGNVVRVELPSDEEAGYASKQKVVIDAPVVMTESELRIWAQDHSETWRGVGSGDMEDTIVQGQHLIFTRRRSTGNFDAIRVKVLSMSTSRTRNTLFSLVKIPQYLTYRP